jgi:hypothetical protein
LGNIGSDTFGKSSQRVISQILEQSGKPLDLPSLIQGSMIPNLPELEVAVDEVFSPEQATKLKISLQHYDDLKIQKAELEQLILALAMPYQQEINLILTVPSFKNIFSAITILSEIGTNMEAFPSAKHLWVLVQKIKL